MHNNRIISKKPKSTRINTISSWELSFVWNHFVFEPDDNLKHNSFLGKNYLLEKDKVNVIDWPAQDPELNHRENMWGKPKTRLHARWPVNLGEDVERFIKEQWTEIVQETCLKLIANETKWLHAIIQQEWHTFDYEYWAMIWKVIFC